MTILADVALANPTDPLPFIAALLCFVVVPLEAACFYFLQRRVARVSRSLGLILLANAASLGVGFIITQTVSPPGRNVPEMIIWTAAFFLSWLIEYAVLRLFRNRLRLTRLGLTTGVANAASYVALILIATWRS